MSNEKEFLKYGFLTVFLITGIVYLFTGDFNRTVNAACGGSLTVLFGLICLRYKTKEYINRNKLVNLLAYALLCLCAGILLSAMFTTTSALSVDVLQDGKYTQLNITGEPPFDIYTDEGDNRYTWSNIVVLELEEGRTNNLVIIDGLNDTATVNVDIPIMSVDIFISILVIIAALFSLLGIRYPLFIIPAMTFSMIWFGYLSKNPYLDDIQVLVHSIIAICPFLAMAYWGLNK
ncbi:MAG: hypothetical protein WAO24_01080 [Peptococcia bacterium]